MRQVTVSGTVPRSPSTVFEFVLDGRNDERWCPLVDDVQLVAGEPGVGATYRFHQQAGPASQPMVVRTTVVERPRLIEWSSVSGAPYWARIELTPTGEGDTMIRHTNQVTMPNAPLQLVWSISARIVLRLQLRRLRRELTR